MLLLIPTVIAKPKIKLTKGTVAEDINAFFLIDSKLKLYKLPTASLSVVYILKSSEWAYIRFNYMGTKFWYRTKLNKIKEP